MKLYEHCIFRKQKRVRFSKGVHNTKVTLDYIHSDIWESARVSSKGCACYMLTIIDDFSKKIWVFSVLSKGCAYF